MRVPRPTLRTTLLLAALVCVPGCGPEGPTLPPTDKRVPTIELLYEGRTLVAWKAVPADAPAGERAAAAWALAALEMQPAESVGALLRLLRDEDPSVRLAAVVAAGRLALPSSEAAEVLVSYFGAPEEALRRHARQAAAQLGVHAVKPLTQALGHESKRVRWAALTALRRVGADAASSLGAVARLARTEQDPAVRRAALFALPRLGSDGVEAALFFLRSSELAVRHEAAASLAEAGAAVVGPVAGWLKDEDEEVAAMAAGVLADLGKDAESALPQLVDALSRAGPVSANAAEALIGIGLPAVPALQELAASESESLSAIAAYCLEQISRQ